MKAKGKTRVNGKKVTRSGGAKKKSVPKGAKMKSAEELAKLTKEQLLMQPNAHLKGTASMIGNLYGMNFEAFVRGAKYEPDELLKKFFEYAEFTNNDTYWDRAEVVKSGDYVGTILRVPVKSPYTVVGFCVFIGIVRSTFYDYAKQAAYSNICAYIEDCCYKQKLVGAMNGHFNAAIIARDLGLVDKTATSLDVDAKKDIKELFGKLGLKKKKSVDE